MLTRWACPVPGCGFVCVEPGASASVALLAAWEVAYAAEHEGVLPEWRDAAVWRMERVQGALADHLGTHEAAALVPNGANSA